MTKVFQQEICPVYNTQGDVTTVRINYRVFGKLVKTVRRPIEKCTVVWSKTFRPRTQEPASALQQLGRAMSEI